MTTTTPSKRRRPPPPLPRPSLSAANWVWRGRGQTDIAGIGLFKSGKITAHLTSEEARGLADKLHDMADKLEGVAS